LKRGLRMELLPLTKRKKRRTSNPCLRKRMIR
jgi:hypothetical protein